MTAGQTDCPSAHKHSHRCDATVTCIAALPWHKPVHESGVLGFTRGWKHGRRTRHLVVHIASRLL